MVCGAPLVGLTASERLECTGQHAWLDGSKTEEMTTPRRPGSASMETEMETSLISKNDMDVAT